VTDSLQRLNTRCQVTRIFPRIHAFKPGLVLPVSTQQYCGGDLTQNENVHAHILSSLTLLEDMGVDHGGDGGVQFSQNLEWGTLMQIAPLRFCHVSKFQAPDCSKHQHMGTKGAFFCGLQNTLKCVSDRGATSDPAGGAHDTPHPLSRLGR